MISKNITINIPTDMEARPVALLVQVACKEGDSHRDAALRWNAGCTAH